MASCEDHEIAIERRLHPALGDPERAALEEHLVGCEGRRACERAARGAEAEMRARAGAAAAGVDWARGERGIRRGVHASVRMCRGDSYEFWDLFEASFHLVCPAEHGTFFLFGTDRLGRDVLSRIIHGTRISLTVGLLGIAVSFLIGIILGGISGYYGGWIDSLIQRFIEMVRSFRELPLRMALSAALPVNWSPVLVYFGITIILGLLDWRGLARAVRSKLLALREEDFASAAVLMGVTPGRVIGRHLLPSFTSPRPRPGLWSGGAMIRRTMEPARPN